MCTFIALCELSQEAQAAWFQAIASFVAILIAIAVPAIQHWLDGSTRRNEREAASRSMALSLYGDLQEVGDKLNDVWGLEHPDELSDDAPPLRQYAEEALKLPQKLAAMADRLHELGKPGRRAQAMVYHLRAASDSLTHGTQGQLIIFEKKIFYDHLWAATSRMPQC